MTVLAFGGHEDGHDIPAGGRARAALERVPNLPAPSRLAASSRWWATTGARKLFALAVRAPLLLVLELRPIGVGLGRMVGGWARWCAAESYAANIAASRTAGEVDKRDADRLESRRERRRLLSGILFAAVSVAAFVAAARWPGWLALAGGALVLVADAVGRRGAGPPSVTLPPPARAVLTEGVPLAQVTRTLVERAADRWGITLGIARAMTYSVPRREYEVWVTSADPITAEVLRDLERALGASDHSIRCLAPPDGRADLRRLVIREGDPLAEVPPAPWIPTGTRSIGDPLDLGVSLTDTPFALVFAGEHTKVVGATGSGKTSWFLRSAIDRISACRDAVVWGVDLTAGPELPLWRGVIQRRAFTPAEAERLLTDALAEIDRRAAVLAGFAEDDDPANDDITEWCSALGPALIVVVDEFSTLAGYDGKGGRPDLLGRCEQIVRTGRKHWVSLVAVAQKTGNEDFGSTTMTTQANTSVALPCSAADAVRLFGAERRDAGWTPHLLQPGTKTERRDAGKCYVESPLHHTPDIYSCYAPMSAGEVKRRARQRLADGLPQLAGGPAPAADGAVDVVEVPTLLADVEQVFVEQGVDRIPTAELLAALRDLGHELDGHALAEQLTECGVARTDRRWRPGRGANPVRGYLLADISDALRGLG